MTLQQLRYAVTVAETGSLTEAASRLFLSQPSLTGSIRALEKEMHVTIFARESRGMRVTPEGEEFLSYARSVLEQSDLLMERYAGGEKTSPRFSVSCQHYSFAVNAFVDVIRSFHADEYDFTLRETQTHEIIEDVSMGKSEIGILYLSPGNREVLMKLIRRNSLEFCPLFEARPHVFISLRHPLAGKECLNLEDLEPYPYLSFEQGDYNSFYFSEELLSSLDSKKNIKVRDRATLFNLVIGLNGYTVSSGVISHELNGEEIIARPLNIPGTMEIGTITRKGMLLSRYAETYMEALKRHIREE